MRNKTYLIQRLNKPINYINPFSFGGGLVDGGFSKEAMNIIKNICSFDYMGSSEFEWGAVPDAFEAILKNVQAYTSKTIEINNIPIYIIGSSADINNIIDVINNVAHENIHLKESAQLKWALGLEEYLKKENCSTVGWVELDNHFMFFIDEKMFNDFKTIFNIK